ncbi:Metallo-dependent phosphatase [Laetiporus sulphureus 93-53]|uniref:Metallo-dependent phosphatase n=1 Tax=Laetiporus sulphureus 93-53 TaxID=1314785 RepID=A0A165HBQ5_9APHY|nr:Metallo-dependent phosphatase [Laetiporus sulphureus 93-53]KZT11516.1 Metallo-dependent phosphatase [Laetiporus sulphureus 93-53]
MSVVLPILHFNDVYRVQPFRVSPDSPETIDVTQWAAMLDDIRDGWPVRPDGKRDGLVLFSGDVFSPSVESSVTRGSHMVPVLNAIAPDVALTGNHDFDFGYPHLTNLINDTNFPWLLSNIIDINTGRVPECTHEFQVLERRGVRVGVIGLVEKEWIGTVSSWPENFEYRNMAEVGIELSKRLRDPDGEHKCDIVIALTHSRVPNDIALAKALHALSPAFQQKTPINNMHGVDIILGGHDHLYYISRGVTAWEGYDTTHSVLGAEADEGDVLIVKTGCDFRDLSEFALTLVDTPPSSVRRKVIKEIRGKRHQTKPGSKKNQRIANLLKDILASVSDALKKPVCKTDVVLDLRSELIRTRETASANWFADVLRHAYDEMPQMNGGSDGVFICAGTLRGDSMYGPGTIALGNILEILPFEDSVVVLELDGETIWAALEESLETWPAQEGRFPVISGFRVSWDSRRLPGERVLGVWLLQELSGSASTSASPTPTPSATSSMTSLQSIQSTASGAASPAYMLVDGEPIPRSKKGRKYRMVTREYMAEGYDGFEALKGQKYLVDDESGQLMSALVRKYLLGCRYVNRMSRLSISDEAEPQPTLHPDTQNIIMRERARQERYERNSQTQPPSRSGSEHHLHHHHHLGIANKWRHAARLALRWSRAHYQDHFGVSLREHMSGVDTFDGNRVRKGMASQRGPTRGDDGGEGENEDLAVIHPVVDGRLKDEGRT